MEIFDDVMYNIFEYPSILGNLILKESKHINQYIKENITKLNNLSFEYNNYIPNIIISIIITLFLILIGIIILYKHKYKHTKIIKQTQHNKQLDLSKKPIIINKGLYLESVEELNIASNILIKNIKKGQIYWVLIRAQMIDYIEMMGTKFELHGNNIRCNKNNTKTTFYTKDVYIILKFKIINDLHSDLLLGNQIIHFMNELNYETYCTQDFIICAISTSPNVEPKEFYNGLKYINYELENNIQVNKKLHNTNQLICYRILLPIHQVYDLFMDVYNTSIFESSKYVIDNENYESWNGKSINEIHF